MAVVDHDQDPAIRGQGDRILVPGHSPIFPTIRRSPASCKEVMAFLEQDGYVRQRAKQALQVTKPLRDLLAARLYAPSALLRFAALPDLPGRLSSNRAG